jgi:hypothetical protein
VGSRPLDRTETSRSGRAERYVEVSDDLRPLTPLTGGSARDFLDRRGIEHRGLSERDALHLAYVLAGFVLTVPGGSGPITALVWIASALTAGGRYVAPELTGHVADLGDGGSLVDSIVLMAVVQRHLLCEPRPGWGNDELARDLGLDPEDIARAQETLDRVAWPTRHPAVLGVRWWERNLIADDPGTPPTR